MTTDIPDLWSRAEHYREASLLLTADDSLCDYRCPHPPCIHEVGRLLRVVAHGLLATVNKTVEQDAAELDEQVRQDRAVSFKIEQPAPEPPL